MKIKDAIEWFKTIQPENDYEANIYCAEICGSLGKLVYVEPEGYLFERAIEALEYEDKYRWHDIRKNPDDLPENDQEEVLVVKRDDIISVIHAYTLKGSTKLFKAWKRIENFEGGEENAVDQMLRLDAIAGTTGGVNMNKAPHFTRNEYNAIKKMDRKQMEEWILKVHKEAYEAGRFDGLKEGREQTKVSDLDEERLTEKITEIKGIGGVKARKVAVTVIGFLKGEDE